MATLDSRTVARRTCPRARQPYTRKCLGTARHTDPRRCVPHPFEHGDAVDGAERGRACGAGLLGASASHQCGAGPATAKARGASPSLRDRRTRSCHPRAVPSSGTAHAMRGASGSWHGRNREHRRRSRPRHGSTEQCGRTRRFRRFRRSPASHLRRLEATHAALVDGRGACLAHQWLFVGSAPEWAADVTTRGARLVARRPACLSAIESAPVLAGNGRSGP